MATQRSRDRLDSQHEQEWLLFDAITDTRWSNRLTFACMFLPVLVAYITLAALIVHWIAGWAW